MRRLGKIYTVLLIFMGYCFISGSTVQSCCCGSDDGVRKPSNGVQAQPRVDGRRVPSRPVSGMDLDVESDDLNPPRSEVARSLRRGASTGADSDLVGSATTGVQHDFSEPEPRQIRRSGRPGTPARPAPCLGRYAEQTLDRSGQVSDPITWLQGEAVSHPHAVIDCAVAVTPHKEPKNRADKSAEQEWDESQSGFLYKDPINYEADLVAMGFSDGIMVQPSRQ